MSYRLRYLLCGPCRCCILSISRNCGFPYTSVSDIALTLSCFVQEAFVNRFTILIYNIVFLLATLTVASVLWFYDPFVDLAGFMLARNKAFYVTTATIAVCACVFGFVAAKQRDVTRMRSYVPMVCFNIIACMLFLNPFLKCRCNCQLTDELQCKVIALFVKAGDNELHELAAKAEGTTIMDKTFRSWKYKDPLRMQSYFTVSKPGIWWNYSGTGDTSCFEQTVVVDDIDALMCNILDFKYSGDWTKWEYQEEDDHDHTDHKHGDPKTGKRFLESIKQLLKLCVADMLCSFVHTHLLQIVQGVGSKAWLTHSTCLVHGTAWVIVNNDEFEKDLDQRLSCEVSEPTSASMAQDSDWWAKHASLHLWFEKDKWQSFIRQFKSAKTMCRVVKRTVTIIMVSCGLASVLMLPLCCKFVQMQCGDYFWVAPQFSIRDSRADSDMDDFDAMASSYPLSSVDTMDSNGMVMGQSIDGLEGGPYNIDNMD